MGNPFSESTQAEAVGAGRYRGHIDELWNLRPLPQGGVVAALALRAMVTELDDPGQRLRVAHTSFVAQVSDGPVDIDVEVLRRGRSMSHLQAEVRNPGAPRAPARRSPTKPPSSRTPADAAVPNTSAT